MNENEFKDALDAARYQSRMREEVEEEDDGEASAYTGTLAEDDSDIEIERDRWGRMIVRRNGKVTYYEGKTDDPR